MKRLHRFLTLIVIGALILCSARTARSQSAYFDPGHGGVCPAPDCDPGGPTPIEGYWEKDVNLAVGLALYDILGDHYFGFDIYYSRLEDVGVARTRRAYEANGYGCSTFVSIHHNTDTSEATQYSLTLYSELPQCDGAGNPWFGHTRNTTSLLATKIGYKIRDN